VLKIVMNKKALQSLVVSASILSATLVFGLAFNWQGNSMHIARIAKALYGQSSVKSQTSAARTATFSPSNAIQLSVKEEESEGLYRWVSSSDGTINPTLKASANNANIIKIQNPTDTKHELIIDTPNDHPSSGDINPDSPDQLSFKPTMTGTFTYHCAYHPQTMKGTIQVVSGP
jgi:plastocyanin